MKGLFGVLANLSSLCAVLLSEVASAQPILTQRCTADSLNQIQAEARVNWARRCALSRNVQNPALWFDTGMVSANGVGSLKDYSEWAPGAEGQNRYTGDVQGYDVNSTTLFSLYNSTVTSQGVDANGYYEWWRTTSRRRARPLYPIFGSARDINSATQLFPHPQLLNCNFYLDKNGTVPASGYSFYVNGYCEAANSQDRCATDRLSPREARARLDWARRCALTQNVVSPSAWTDTDVPTADATSTLKEYSEAGAPSDRQYIGGIHSFDINDTYTFALYQSGPTWQSVDAQGFYMWSRDSSRIKQRPLYPIFGSTPNLTSGVQLFPSSTLSDCSLYNGTTAVSSFYVNKYCESIY